jgi:hypothetical protein
MHTEFNEQYRERDNLISDAIQLKRTDRVPIMLELSYFPATYSGITSESAFYDYDKWLRAYCATLEDYEPDMVQITSFFPGKVYEILKPRQVKLPGQGIDPHHSHQFMEGEYLRANEYDLFMKDHSDFLLRSYIPRIFGALEPFGNLPAIIDSASSYRDLPRLAESLSDPEIQGALSCLLNAGREMAKWRNKINEFGEKIEAIGFPLYGVGGEHIPFDHLSYHVRGLRGIYLDMYRQPEKLIEVFNWLLPIQIKKAIRRAKASNRKRVYFALHRGGDTFMSPEQFNKYYWPYAKQLIFALVEDGFYPCIFLEGDYTSRLEHLLELPKGKVLCRFDSSDIFKAKKVLKEHLCIMGSVPVSLLQLGGKTDVEDYCKRLIDIVGDGGGFIMAPSGTPDEAKPENLRAMMNITKQYGRYN